MKFRPALREGCPSGKGACWETRSVRSKLRAPSNSTAAARTATASSIPRLTPAIHWSLLYRASTSWRPAGPRRWHISGSLQSWTIASRKASTSDGGTRRQFTPCSRTPIWPAVSVQITAFPIANASRMVVIPLSLSESGGARQRTVIVRTTPANGKRLRSHGHAGRNGSSSTVARHHLSEVVLNIRCLRRCDRNLQRPQGLEQCPIIAHLLSHAADQVVCSVIGRQNLVSVPNRTLTNRSTGTPSSCSTNWRWRGAQTMNRSMPRQSCSTG